MRRRLIAAAAVVVAIVVVIAVIAITQPKEQEPITNDERLMSIPSSSTKMTAALDAFRPVVLSDKWQQPVPMPGPVNTAGGEDSAFITPDGNWFFFFFTPDVSVPAELQILDGVTGIWWMQRNGTSWTSPEKVILHDDLSLDGAQFVLGNTMWFASVREGNYGEIDIYTAEYVDGEWTEVKNSGEQLNVEYDIGEFHITSDGQTMYFHGGVSDTADDLNIWVCHRTDDGWSVPTIVPNVSADGLEGWPFVTSDGGELWFTSFSSVEGYQGPSIYRSVKQDDGTWGDPDEIIANFAGEPTLDDAGNIYFTHHYFTDNSEMIEADIYVAFAR
ncbi:MAG: PD40 domain-containing protein [Methanobacteriota archaeon]|nr:MAG: PD40 domain-containing protein [Euryarchaeota archaeon]